MDLSSRHARARPRLRDHAARARWRVVRHRSEQLRLGARCAHRQAVLGVSPLAAVRSHVRLVGARESRLRPARRPAVHGDARRAPARARSAQRRGDLGRRARGLQARLRGDPRPARRRGSRDRRNFRRRVRRARLPRRIRSRDGRARVAALHRARARRARQRDLAEQHAGARRRDLDDRQLRPRSRAFVLGHRQSESGLLRRGTQRRQSVHELVARDRSAHGPRALALPIHAARHSRLGRESRTRARGLTHRRPVACRRAGREPQRLLLRARSRDRRVAGCKAFHRDHLGARDRRRRAAGRVERGRQQRLPAGPVGRDQFLSAVVRSAAPAVLRERARDVRDVSQPGAARRARGSQHGRRDLGRRGSGVRRAAGARRRDRCAALGISGADADDGAAS